VHLTRRAASVTLLSVLALPGHAGSYEDFFTAIEKDDVAVIQQLLARGFDSNTVNPRGVPALMVAIRSPAPKSVQVLLKQPGIKVEARNPQDESALMLAAFVGNLDLCKQLLDLDADVNKPGWAPLHYAATNSHTAVMQLLLDSFAYIDAASPNGTTPLMMAAMYGNASAVKLLLEGGADPTLKNDKELSAIEFARQAGKTESEQIIAAFLRGRRAKGTW
jgi:ankyrin repeat protein